jgi:hypothetical protein
MQQLYHKEVKQKKEDDRRNATPYMYIYISAYMTSPYVMAGAATLPGCTPFAAKSKSIFPPAPPAFTRTHAPIQATPRDL